MTRDPRVPWETDRKRAASLTMINVIYNCEYLPPSMGTALPVYLTKATDELMRALKVRHANRLLPVYRDLRYCAVCDVAPIKLTPTNPATGNVSTPGLSARWSLWPRRCQEAGGQSYSTSATTAGQSTEQKTVLRAANPIVYGYIAQVILAGLDYHVPGSCGDRCSWRTLFCPGDSPFR